MPPQDPETARWFAEEVQPHDAQLKGYLRSSFPAVHDVDDLVQESYLRIWQVRVAQPIVLAKGLLFQIARRLAIDALRHDRASPIDAGRDLAALSVFSDEPDAAEAAALQERKRHLVDAVASLPQRYREIVLLRKFEYLPQREVAARLGLSERTVENLLARAIRKCEDHLRRRGVLDRFQR
ncbi:MAG: sigma-70 family RNA polymerase sigma factor [Opitutaceae bacterium]|nr:sigma-70 family RNA polymerase sigma factor [Opitutaceae bacterium]